MGDRDARGLGPMFRESASGPGGVESDVRPVSLSDPGPVPSVRASGARTCLRGDYKQSARQTTGINWLALCEKFANFPDEPALYVSDVQILSNFQVTVTGHITTHVRICITRKARGSRILFAFFRRMSASTKARRRNLQRGRPLRERLSKRRKHEKNGDTFERLIVNEWIPVRRNSLAHEVLTKDAKLFKHKSPC